MSLTMSFFSFYRLAGLDGMRTDGTTGQHFTIQDEDRAAIAEFGCADHSGHLDQLVTDCADDNLSLAMNTIDDEPSAAAFRAKHKQIISFLCFGRQAEHFRETNDGQH